MNIQMRIITDSNIDQVMNLKNNKEIKSYKWSDKDKEAFILMKTGEADQCEQYLSVIESYSENNKLYIEEGERWVRRKYGFNSRWSMQQYVKSFYDHFFEFHPEYIKYKI